MYIDISSGVLTWWPNRARRRSSFLSGHDGPTGWRRCRPCRACRWTRYTSRITTNTWRKGSEGWSSIRWNCGHLWLCNRAPTDKCLNIYMNSQIPNLWSGQIITAAIAAAAIVLSRKHFVITCQYILAKAEKSSRLPFPVRCRRRSFKFSFRYLFHLFHI